MTLPKIAIGNVVRDMTPAEILAWEQAQAANAPTLEEAIATKLAELDDYRWQMEIGGVEFAGATIRTDANSQAKIAAVYTMARFDQAFSVPTWEVTPGQFMALDNATIVAMGEAVRDHVQATFNRKAILHGLIAELESVEAVEAFDIAAEWLDSSDPQF